MRILILSIAAYNRFVVVYDVLPSVGIIMGQPRFLSRQARIILSKWTQPAKPPQLEPRRHCPPTRRFNIDHNNCQTSFLI